jgi:heme oxygenase (biliverdin-producing, ferredoxin)
VNTSLGSRLRAQTRELHIRAEHRPFMQSLLRGQMQREPYCLLLRNLHPLYTTLESALKAHEAHLMVAPVFNRALLRAHALECDLATLHGARWQDELTVVPACKDYCARLVHLQHSAPPLLAAHAYVRYLGDLSGGQILRRIVRAGLQLASPSGTDFYDFGDTAQCAALVQSFREGLERIAPEPVQADAIIAEAQQAYRLHLNLFDQLALASPAHGFTVR